MTPVDEAVERVKEYVESWSSDEPDTAIITDPLDADDPVVTLGDLRALLSALELGRQAQQSPAGLGLHPSALQEPSGADGEFRADHFAGILCQVLDWSAALISQSLSRPHDQAWAEAKAEYDKWSSRAKAALSASTTDSGKGRLDAEARLHVEDETVCEPSDADVARMVKRIEGFSHSYHPEGMARSELDGWIERYPHEWQVLVYTVNKVRRAVASLTASQAHVKHKAEGDCEPQPKDTK